MSGKKKMNNLATALLKVLNGVIHVDVFTTINTQVAQTIIARSRHFIIG